MTIDVSPTTKTPTHHISLEDPATGTKYGLILAPNGNAIQRRPRQGSNYVPFTQNDWSGGRGLKMATDDRSRFADSKRLNTRRPGLITLGGQETYSTGYRQVEQYMGGNVVWQSLLDADRYIAHRFQAFGTGNRAAAYLWIRRRGTPTSTLTVELCEDDTGDPGNVLRTVTATTADIPDTLSQLYEFLFSLVQAVTITTTYHLKVYTSTADDADNYWQVGTDGDNPFGVVTQSSANGTDWDTAAYGLYIRVVDDSDIAGALPFIYKSQLYKLTRPTTTTVPRLLMNGYRGVATGAGQSRTVLKDTTQAFGVNELVGKLLLIIDGPNSEWSQPYRTILSNDGDEIVTDPFGMAHVAGKTTYVILGTTTWAEITGHGLTVLPTDVEGAGDMVYFAQGDTVKMRRMQETNIAGVWTRTFAEEDNYAKLLMVYKETRGMMILKANDYDNSNRPSVSMAPVEAWGTRLAFPRLVEACDDTTGWTMAAGHSIATESSLYKTGSASLKMTIAVGAAGVFAYRTFSPAESFYKQKKIRMWVYVAFTINAAVLAIRISTATDATTSIQDVALPALEGGKWTQIELPYKDANVGITAVQSLGFIKVATTGVIDLYIDGIETVPDGSEVPLGNDTERITGLELYGDPAVPHVFRSGSVGSIENGNFIPLPLREYSQVENIHNGVGHLVHDVYLFYSFLQGLEQYYRANLDDIGPNKDEGLPPERQGYITSMVGYPDRFLANYDAGGSGYSSILTHKGGGWHEEYRCDTIGKRIRSMILQIIPGDMADRLWFVEGEDIVFLPMPGNTVNELTDSTYRFTQEGALELAWIGDDQQRIFSGVKLGLENVSADRCIEWDYRLDENAAWTAMPTPFTSGPVQALPLNKTGKRLKLRFRLQTNDATQTPRITSINVSTTEQPDTRYAYSMTFEYRDNGVDLLAHAENYSRAEILINQLDTWAANKTPLLMRSISSPIDGGSGKTVFLDPIPIGPVANQTNEQQEKMSGTLTAVEPL